MASGTGFGNYSARMIPCMPCLPKGVDFLSEEGLEQPAWSKDLMHKVRQLDAHILPFEQETPQFCDLLRKCIHFLRRKRIKL